MCVRQPHLPQSRNVSTLQKVKGKRTNPHLKHNPSKLHEDQKSPEKQNFHSVVIVNFYTLQLWQKILKLKCKYSYHCHCEEIGGKKDKEKLTPNLVLRKFRGEKNEENPEYQNHLSIGSQEERRESRKH